MYKKRTFYTYAHKGKYSPYVKMCYYMSAHAFYSEKPPVLQILGGFLFCIHVVHFIFINSLDERVMSLST
ncbi:hypothetical protein QF029_005820 [Priestia megaterium]|nr:hypothetical protein [Priestia megaterium]